MSSFDLNGGGGVVNMGIESAHGVGVAGVGSGLLTAIADYMLRFLSSFKSFWYDL
jgi:hypothetical protein